MKHVVIIGAGFAGFLTAKRLAQRAQGSVQITLVDPKDHFLFAPLLIDVLQDDLKPEQITIPLAEMAQKQKIAFIQGRVVQIQRADQRVQVETAEGVRELGFDILVITSGATTNYFGNASAEKVSFPLKTLKDAARLRSRIEWIIKQATATEDSTERRRLLSFCVVGAGATGIEALCSMQDIAYEATHQVPALRSDMQFHLFQAATQILPGFPLRMVNFALAECEKRGFMVHCGVPVSEVTEQSLVCVDGSRFDAGCVLWSAGLAPNMVSVDIDLPKAGPWLNVDAFLRVSDTIFAAGDIVSASYQKVLVPKNAQTARLMAFVLAENVWRTLTARRDLKPFTYFSKGTLLVMGQNGYADFRWFGLPGAWVGKVRAFFYRVMMWQMAR